MTAPGFMWVAGPGYRPNGADDKRREGDPVPEAFNWPRVDVWEKQGHIKKAFDSAQDLPNPDASSPASGPGAGDGEESMGTSPDAPPLSTPAGGDDGLEQEAPPPLAPPPPPAPVTGDALMQALEQAPFEASASQPDAADDKPPAKSTPKRKRKTTKRKPRKKAKTKSTRAKRGARAKE